MSAPATAHTAQRDTESELCASYHGAASPEAGRPKDTERPPDVLIAAAVAALALALRLIYLWGLSDSPFFSYVYPGSDSVNFELGARALAAGDLMAPSPNETYAPL